jgi:hypothetical protein
MLTVNHRHICDCTISTRPSDAHNWRIISITFTFADLSCFYIPSSALPRIPSTETNLMLQPHRKENSSFLSVSGTESTLYSDLFGEVSRLRSKHGWHHPHSRHITATSLTPSPVSSTDTKLRAQELSEYSTNLSVGVRAT